MPWGFRDLTSYENHVNGIISLRRNASRQSDLFFKHGCWCPGSDTCKCPGSWFMLGLPDYWCRVPLWMWGDHMIISSPHWNFLCWCEGVLILNQLLELRGPYQPLTPAKQFHKCVELTWNSEMQSLQNRKTLPYPKTCKNYVILFIYFLPKPTVY